MKILLRMLTYYISNFLKECVITFEATNTLDFIHLKYEPIKV